jgi:hypothetical protein
MGSRADTVVRAWERVQDSAEWQRPAALLAALSSVPLAEALTLGVARRDAALLAWHTTLFGPRWRAYAQCPACEAALEYDIPVDREALVAPPDHLAIEAGGRQWVARWPDSRDLAEAAACQDRDAARALLVTRIVAAEAEPAAVAAILAALAAAHRGCWTMALRCCDCSRSWDVVFDAGEFLWRELGAAARRILREVDVLARVYHWSEADILALSDTRRHAYLEIVQ